MIHALTNFDPEIAQAVREINDEFKAIARESGESRQQ